MKFILIGLGTVGQGLLEILRDKEVELQARYGFAPQLVGVATRTHGTLYQPQGLNIGALLEALTKGGFEHYPAAGTLERGTDVLQFIARSGADVLVEASITNLQTGQPALDYCRAAQKQGMHLVLANKGPIAVAYGELQAAAQAAKRLLRFEGTVMAGTPSLTLGMEALAGCKIIEARGILNGTTNYILTQMAGGMAYAEALAQAQALGYAEADPTADVDGWDAAGKLLILAAALFQQPFKMSDLRVSGISHLTLEDLATAKQEGYTYKLIARVNSQGGSVQVERLPLSDPLASVSGGTNALTLKTDLMGDITLIGAGAGRLQTGFALLADLLAIHRYQQ